MRYSLALAWLAVLGLSLLGFREANSSQPPVGHSGAPGEPTCARCHGGASPPPTITLLQDGRAVSTYLPGGPEVQLTLRVEHPNLRRYGFQLTVLSEQSGAENAPSQTLRSLPGQGTTEQSSGERKYIAHFSPSSTGVWTFAWRPPTSNLGTLRWYVAANAVNGQAGSAGDAPGSAVFEMAPEGTLALSPSFTLQGRTLWLSEEVTEVRLYTLEGREVGRYAQVRQLEIAQPGLYLVALYSANGNVQLRRLAVLGQ
ncbi:MAG: choice-of-anchor V domain-containing protein [Bacteroidia bacterium]